MRLGQQALNEARTLGGEALLLGSYKTLGLCVGGGVLLHLAAVGLSILALFQVFPAASCEQGCFRPGLEFCCLGNTLVLWTWGLILGITAISSWLSTRLVTRREFGRSAAVTALVVVIAVIYFGVVGYAFSELALLAVIIFFASFLGYKLAY